MEPPADPTGPRIGAVFFDVGGTIVRPKFTRADTMIAALSSRDHFIGRPQVWKALHEIDLKYAGQVFPRIGEIGEDPVAGRGFWSDYHREFSRSVGVPFDRALDEAFEVEFARVRRLPIGEVYDAYPDSMPCLRRLRDGGLKLGVISNADDQLEAILEATGLFSWFDTVVNSYRERVAKPDAEIFRRALGRLGVRPDESMHVGDLYHFDVLGAHRAGIKPVLIARGDREPQSDVDHGICETVLSLDEIPLLLGL